MSRPRAPDARTDAPPRPSAHAAVGAGVLLIGYGLLVLLGVLAHDAPAAGAASLAVGLVLVAWARPAQLRFRRGAVAAALGAATVIGVLGANYARASRLEGTEWALLGYGAALLAASAFLSRRVGRIEVGTLVAWSFPLLLAPLALFGLNAALSAPGGDGAASPLIHALLVRPSAALLGWLGTPAVVEANNLMVSTPRGRLRMNVGLVCAGLYPMVLFAGLMGLQAWQRPASWARWCIQAVVGVLGLWVLNVLRILMLAKVGQRWGAAALQSVHAHAGWILFALFMAAFWLVFGRWAQRPRKAATP